jgi:hypothetical protein
MYLDERRERFRSTWQAQFSLAYVHAIAATAGISCQVTSVDIDGVDVILGADGSKGLLRYPKLEAQVKSWTKPTERAGSFRYPLKLRNYETLRIPNEQVSVPRILVLVVMPELPEHWLQMTDDQGTLRHCAYWISLAGRSATNYADKVPVDIPRERRLSVRALEEIMERIATGGAP